jgi:hypothetical protein
MPKSPLDRKLELIAKKRHSIRQGFNSLTQGKHGGMPALTAVGQQYGSVTGIRCLQSSGHFPGV